MYGSLWECEEANFYRNVDNKATNMAIICLRDWNFLCVIKEIKCFYSVSDGTFVNSLGNNPWFMKNGSAPSYLSNVCSMRTSTLFQLRFAIKVIFEKYRFHLIYSTSKCNNNTYQFQRHILFILKTSFLSVFNFIFFLSTKIGIKLLSSFAV